MAQALSPENSVAALLARNPSVRALEARILRSEMWVADVRRFYPWPALEHSIALDIALMRERLADHHTAPRRKRIRR